jgi:phage tail sheath protein FI
LFSGTAGTVVEKFAFASKASDAKRSDGTSAYYKDVVNTQSEYVYWMDHTSNVTATGTAWGNAANASLFANLTSNVTISLSGGVSADSPTDGNLTSALAIFANDELYDISLLPLGAASSTVVNFAISSVAEVRKDVIVFASPELADVVNNAGTEATDVVTFRESLTSSSYAVLDSGWKYQYDRYNDVYRYVPLNGDTAGLAVRTDFVADPWFSPAGFNRGQVKNVVKLAYSPSKADRDTLYKKGVNPVVTFPGNGTVLFGDKTLLAKPSAFDRINVRRLFIVLEKAIATAAKFQLFEFNDPFTRAQFRNLVEPFLRDVQGRRGITDFKVVCDESNNTAQVIDTNNFVADIFIKPARAINFIQLNFIATRTGISFEEVGA